MAGVKSDGSGSGLVLLDVFRSPYAHRAGGEGPGVRARRAGPRRQERPPPPLQPRAPPRRPPRLRVPRHPPVPRRGVPGGAAAPPAGVRLLRARFWAEYADRQAPPLREAPVAVRSAWCRRRWGGGARGAGGDGVRAARAGGRARGGGVLRRRGVRVRGRRGGAVRGVVPHVRAPRRAQRGGGVPGVGGAVRAPGERRCQRVPAGRRRRCTRYELVQEYWQWVLGRK